MEPEITNREIEQSAERLSRFCRFPSHILAFFSCVVMLPVFLSPFIIFGSITSVGPFSYTGSIAALVTMVGQSALLSISLILMRRVFVDIAGKRPFYRTQSRSLLVAGISMLLCAFLETIPYGYASLSFQIGVISVGLELARTSPSFINISTLLCSVSLLTISAVFKYGYFLQRISEDTV